MFEILVNYWLKKFSKSSNVVFLFKTLLNQSTDNFIRDLIFALQKEYSLYSSFPVRWRYQGLVYTQFIWKESLSITCSDHLKRSHLICDNLIS